MNFRDLFILNLKTFIIDLIIFIIGCFLTLGFFTVCISDSADICPQPVVFYIGFILIIISVIHFMINLIIYKKIRIKKRKK